VGGRTLRPDEKRAWARVARKVRPREGVEVPETMDALLDDANRQQPSKTPSRYTPGANATMSAITSTEPRSKSGLQNRDRERKVRRGQIDIAASLDLHGHTQASGHTALTGFLIRQREQGARCVLVITGKGKRGEGILRQRFLQWLDTPDARETVSGFAPAHRKHGGGGAWYVFLRRLPD